MFLYVALVKNPLPCEKHTHLACYSRMAVGFLTSTTCKKVWHKSYTSGHCLQPTRYDLLLLNRNSDLHSSQGSRAYQIVQNILHNSSCQQGQREVLINKNIKVCKVLPIVCWKPFFKKIGNNNEKLKNNEFLTAKPANQSLCCSDRGSLAQQRRVVSLGVLRPNPLHPAAKPH